MASRNYQNFDLLIEATQTGYMAHVTSCPQGDSASTAFELPFDETKLKLLLLTIDPGRSGTRRNAPSRQAQAAYDLGGPLFSAVFTHDVLHAWERSLDHVASRGEGLRLRLRLGKVPDLAGLPWELLYDARYNTFIAQSERTPLVRYLELPQPPQPLEMDGPLRILAVMSSPTDQPELDTGREWRRLQESLKPKVEDGSIVLDQLSMPSMSDLLKWLRTHQVNVLHFVGHGDFDESIEDGVLFFTNEYSGTAKVSPSLLGSYLRDHDHLRLVVLNACHSARADMVDPFSGMAQGLIQQGIPAVVAMQFPISDGAAASFAGEFYGAVADGFPVDQATTNARKRLMADHEAEWATPVVFLRAPDGAVFRGLTPGPSRVATRSAQPPVEHGASGSEASARPAPIQAAPAAATVPAAAAASAAPSAAASNPATDAAPAAAHSTPTAPAAFADVRQENAPPRPGPTWSPQVAPQQQYPQQYAQQQPQYAPGTVPGWQPAGWQPPPPTPGSWTAQQPQPAPPPGYWAPQPAAPSGPSTSKRGLWAMWVMIVCFVFTGFCLIAAGAAPTGSEDEAAAVGATFFWGVLGVVFLLVWRTRRKG